MSQSFAFLNENYVDFRQEETLARMWSLRCISCYLVSVERLKRYSNCVFAAWHVGMLKAD